METKTHRLAALIGPNGELAMGNAPPEKVDWAWLWDCTEDWGCDESYIRKACIIVHAPILGKPALLQVDSHDVEFEL